MRKKNAQSLRDVLQDLVSEQHLDIHLNELELIAVWPQVVGQAINNYTRQLHVRNQTLYIQLSSSVLRNELMMHRQDLIDRLNERVGTVVIRQIVLR